MTLAIPASRTAASNGNSCSSRSSRGADVGGGLVQPALGQTVADQVLAGGDDTDRSGRAPWSAADIGHAEVGGEIRILAIGLLDPAPAWVAAMSRTGRQRMPCAGREHPSADRGRDAATRSGSKLAAAPIDCWKHGASQASSPWRHLLVDDRRDAEAGLLDEVALDRVGRLRRPRAGGGSSSRPGG